MTLRLAAYGLCVSQGRILLTLCRTVNGDEVWTLPGGKVEHAEDPVETVTRELAEETGCTGVVERLLGVDSRTIPSAERLIPDLPDLHNVGIFYAVMVTGGQLRPEPNGDTVDSMWTPLAEVTGLRRSSLVDVGLDLFTSTPATGHVAPVPVGGLIQH